MGFVNSNFRQKFEKSDKLILRKWCWDGWDDEQTAEFMEVFSMN